MLLFNTPGVVAQYPEGKLMDAMAFGPVGLAYALEACKTTVHDGSEWIDPAADPFSDANDLLKWIRRSVAEARQPNDTLYKVADNCASLVDFQREYGLPAQFKPADFAGNALGICSFVNIRVQWQARATPTVLLAQGAETEHAAFTIPQGSFDLYTLGFEQQRVIAIHLKEGGRLWLRLGATRPQNAFELLRVALYAMAQKSPENKRFSSEIRSLIVPAVSIDTLASTKWLEGLELKNYRLARVAQRVKILFNPLGVPVQSDPVLAVRRNHFISPMVVNEPVIGWFTRANSVIPECVFYAHSTSWERVVQ